MKETNNVFPEVSTLLSAAEGQRPRNYLSCCSCSWIFVWSMPYQLPPPCYPHFLSILNLSISIFICRSINQPLPFPKCQYRIAADPGASIGLSFIINVYFWVCLNKKCKLYNRLMRKMSIQYLVPRFKLLTIRLWDSSFNHLTMTSARPSVMKLFWMKSRFHKLKSWK